MKDVNDFPKSVKKAVRYIKQEATKDQLYEIKRLIDSAIKLRHRRVN
ncbi:hypothetical protein QFZ87_001483 [Bacillus sp. SLBN-46]|nr:hypothetical protein [Bacillus sp. SLBN-46]MDR6121886.1 hypothetical protein [Bacillus sp. SLBN-46]